MNARSKKKVMINVGKQANTLAKITNKVDAHAVLP